MLCFQQLSQLNLVIAVENTPTRASAFNLSDPAVVVNERAVTSRHRHEEYSLNPPFVSGSSRISISLMPNNTTVQDLGPAFAGGQYCVVSLEADAAPYMRLHFLLLFLLPVLLCLALMARVSCGLQVD